MFPPPFPFPCRPPPPHPKCGRMARNITASSSDLCGFFLILRNEIPIKGSQNTYRTVECGRRAAVAAIVEMLSCTVVCPPPADTFGGLKAQLVFAGRFVQDKVAAVMNVPPSGTMSKAKLADWPAGTFCESGVTENEKSKVV